MSEWNLLDRLIGKIRYHAVDKYVPDGGVICDIGCGQNADFLRRNEHRFKKGYGFDFRIEDAVVRNITTKNNRGTNRIDLPDDTCDTVFLLAVLEHLDEPCPMLREIHRVLKPGGKLVLTTPTRFAKPILEFMAFNIHIINEEEIREHKHYYNKAEILALLEQTRYKNGSCKWFCLGVNSIAAAEK